jgi:uncharacterized phage protein gp47/JayE
MNVPQFLKDFNTLVETHLTDFDGQFEGCDVSQGSPANLLANIFAAPEWGIYKKLNWLAKQLFVSSCDDDILPLHGAEYGIDKIESETNSAYRQRILTRKRNPVSALNEGAWLRWVRETSYDHGTYVESVKTALLFEDDRGAGSINVVVTSTRTAEQGGEEEPTTELLAAITDTIDANRSPGTTSDFLVIGAAKNTIDVTMTTTGDCDTEETISDITAFMKTAAVGSTLYLDQVRAIAIQNGAESAPISAPADNVTMEKGPFIYERMWPGTIGVT